MEHNVGDRVRVHTLEWFKQNCINPVGYIEIDEVSCFIENMKKFCGKIVTIDSVSQEHYTIKENNDGDMWLFYDWMFEEDEMKEETNWEHYQKEIEKFITSDTCTGCPASKYCDTVPDDDKCGKIFCRWANSKYIPDKSATSYPFYRAWTKDTFPLHIGTEVKEKGSDLIEGISNYCKSAEKIWISNDPTGMTFSEFFAIYERADGTPCGELVNGEETK